MNGVVWVDPRGFDDNAQYWPVPHECIINHCSVKKKKGIDDVTNFRYLRE